MTQVYIYRLQRVNTGPRSARLPSERPIREDRQVVLVGFGLALTFASIPSASYVSTWSEFRSSGWTDATAFGIANAFDSAYSHLLFGPIVGAITGAIGGLVGKQPSPTPVKPDFRIAQSI